MLDIDRIESSWDGCVRCRLSVAGRSRVVIGTGPIPCPWMVIGEAPGATEDERGIPFIGESGQLLRELAREQGIDMGLEAYITNICACRPPGNRAPKDDEMMACKPRLDALVEIVRPKCILLVGSTAYRHFLHGNCSLGQVRGEAYHVRWTWKCQLREAIAIPTYHPAYLMRTNDPKLRRQLSDDIKEAYRIAHG